MSIRLPKIDSATFRGVVTAVQAFVGTLLAIYAVPGVKEVIQTKAPEVAGVIATCAGVVALIWNLVRRDVKNY